MPKETARVGLTAHYTGYVWKKNHLSDFNLHTKRGWFFYQLMRPVNFIAAKTADGSNLETFLIQRHQTIDELLTIEIESGRVNQIIELASGLSPRGTKFMKRYGKTHGLVYIESDLKDQIRAKKNIYVKKNGLPLPNHHFLEIDAFKSIDDAVQEFINPARGCALVTEGLISYFETAQILDLWRRIATFLKQFETGMYFADLQAGEPTQPMALFIKSAIETFSRKKLSLHFQNAKAAQDALLDLGFRSVDLHPLKDANHQLFRIIQAKA